MENRLFISTGSGSGLLKTLGKLSEGLIVNVTKEQEEIWNREKTRCYQNHLKRVVDITLWVRKQSSVGAALMRVQKERGNLIAECVKLKLGKNND